MVHNFKTILIFFIIGILFFTMGGLGSAQEISHYTCGMHPSVNVSVENYNKGDTKCPICFMPLTPVIKADQIQPQDFDQSVISRVNIKMQEAQLAGIKTEAVVRRHLYKEIRAVGTVAYDPDLAVAQDEFIAAVHALSKIKEGHIAEITQRAEKLVQSARRKLFLLGLSQEQIDALAQSQEVQTNLILPDEKMWIYADVYEYEIGWVKVGTPIEVTTISLPGEKFIGFIISINPVIDPKTRSVRVRAEVENPDLRLKPDMYVDMMIQSHYEGPQGGHAVLSIPKDALLDTGLRKIVWVDQGNGQFEGRAVEVGPLAAGMTDGQTSQFYPILKGLDEGMRVVTKGNFLIDSQSQITGAAASVYGGALGTEDKPAENQRVPGHVH